MGFLLKDHAVICFRHSRLQYGDRFGTLRLRPRTRIPPNPASQGPHVRLPVQVTMEGTSAEGTPLILARSQFRVEGFRV